MKTTRTDAINRVSKPISKFFFGFLFLFSALHLSASDPVSVGASGSGPIQYQWYFNTTESNVGGTKIEGAIHATYHPTIIGTRYYYCVITNPCDEFTSDAVPRTVYAAGCGTDFSGSLGTHSFASPGATIIGTQTWSGAVRMSGCVKTTYNGGATPNFNADCRSSTNNAVSGNYFSWCMVMRHAAQLCPAPWRVPTTEDFATLHAALGYTTLPAPLGYVPLIANTYVGTAGTAAAPQIGGSWGGSRFAAYSGYLTDAHSRYWSSSEASTTTARTLALNATTVYPQSEYDKAYGFSLRCVR